jgi:seryl-tRNA synthetase
LANHPAGGPYGEKTILMLQVHILRSETEAVKQKLAKKHFKEIELVDAIIALDDRRKQLQNQADQLQATANAASKEIGTLIRTDKAAAEAKKAEVSALNAQIKPLHEGMQTAERQIDELLVKLPNLPHNSVPNGLKPEENEVVKEAGQKPALQSKAVPHWDLIQQYGLVDFATGAKITGSGFPLYKGRGAKLQRALVQYFLDCNTAAGYVEYSPPYLVNEASAYGTGQLPDKEGQMYFVTEDKLYLIPTSEVPVTNIYRDEVLKESDLPIKMTAYSHCFRREAGSFGSDVRGLNRVHEFEKVEIVQLVNPDTSYTALDEMVNHVEGILQALELPYRILRLCGGDMSFASALTYDFEVYSAAQQKWLECSSVSNFEAFQTNRMKIRYKTENGKTRLAHSLNGSSLALPRIVACLLENNQTENGITIPAVLQPYFGAAEIR